MTREERILLHKKQESMSIGNGQPIISAMQEGVPIFRNINGYLYYCVRKGSEIWYFKGSKTI